MGQSSFCDQMTAVASKIRGHGPVVRPISQVNLELRGDDLDEVFHRARAVALKWMESRAGRALPEAAWQGKSFDLEEVGAQHTSALSLEDGSYWTARNDDADKAIPQRNWTTEIALGRTDACVLFGCRLNCVTHGRDAPVFSSVPGLVRAITDGVCAYLDGRIVTPEPWSIESYDDVDRLIALLVNRERRGDVIVISAVQGDNNNAEVLPIDAARLSRDLRGAAHIAVIGPSASYRLTDEVGREFSIFDGGVRTFRAGLNFDADQPFDHPVATRRRIEEMENQRQGSVIRMLRESALRRTVTGADLEAELPSFAQARQMVSRARRIQAQESGDTSDAELLELALEDNTNLEREKEDIKAEFKGRLEQANQERKQAEAELGEVKAQLRVAQHRIEALEFALENREFSPEPDMPTSLEELPDWAEKNLSGSIVIHNRALRAAKKSAYENPPFVYQTLLALKRYYVPMRRNGGSEAKQAFDKAMAELGLEDTPSFAGSRAGEQGDEYFVDYGARKRVLDQHIKGSNSRDEQRGFRIYYFWDEETEQMVIGWLPSHLRTRAT